jgi:hypothetical protein
MTKYLRISSYIRKPFLIYEFATALIWFFLKDEDNFFLSVHRLNDLHNFYAVLNLDVGQRLNCCIFLFVSLCFSDGFKCRHCFGIFSFRRARRKEASLGTGDGPGEGGSAARLWAQQAARARPPGPEPGLAVRHLLTKRQITKNIILEEGLFKKRLDYEIEIDFKHLTKIDSSRPK